MDSVNAYIETIDDNLKPIVIVLRDTIKDISPKITEELKWNVPTYSINKGICSIIAHKHHVNLQIFQGTKLEDSHILQGTGKNMRHLTYKNPDNMNIDTVKRIIQQAINIDK